jgi:hypothetical protein
MAKLIKGNSVQNIITDGDVIITSPSKIGKTLDEVLDEQQSDIDRLKSNVKYIYAYGGVGGSGSGGSGSGTGSTPVSAFIELDGNAISNGGDDIVLNGAGRYTLKIKLNNAGEKTYLMGYSTIGSVEDKMIKYKLNSDNRYKQEIPITLTANGTLNIKIIDSEENVIGYYQQKYIVDSDIFNVTLNYINLSGETIPFSTEQPYECFVEDYVRQNRFFKIDYSIFLLNYTDVKVTCQIDGGAELRYEESDNIEIPIEGDNCGVFIGDNPILQNEHMGTYTFKATLSYKISGKEVVRERSLMFSVVPSGLYINVRTNGDVLYDNIDILKKDILSGGGVPYKYITQGSSLMMYCKVYEGDMESNAYKYVTKISAFDAIVESGEIVGWNDTGIEEGEQLTEREESSKGVSVKFSTGGIKKITISTEGAKGDNKNETKYFEKFVYVKSFESKCDWYDNKKHTVLGESYFRANQGSDTYKSFPQLSSGIGVLNLTKSSESIIINQEDLDTPKDTLLCTVISLGIQVSNINSENAKIVDIYTTASSSAPTYSLKLNTLFADDGTNKIAIPTEVLNKNDDSKYHLIQIVRNLSGMANNDTIPVYEDSLYIDGLLESSAASTTSASAKVTKFILENINVCYNLINIQYLSPKHSENGKDIKFNPDGFAYQYWLAYKEKYVNSSLSGDRLTEDEIFIKGNMDRIYFDGSNVVVDASVVMDIAGRSDLPTVVFGYNCDNGDEKTISEFMELMWMGRSNGDTTFKSRKIDLYWIPERSVGKFEDYKVSIPANLTDNTNGDAIAANWEIDLQGTSTMRNRIKNYSLRINSRSSTNRDKILFSPKFDIGKPETYLPDVEWTIKADIADSAHANNTSIGKFVNKVCSKIDTNISDATDEAKKFIKNTLEGIPVLMYFMCEGIDESGMKSTKVYYFGIYNFNLGRNSYYNLGYNGGIVDTNLNKSDFMRVFDHITNEVEGKYHKGNVFTFAVGECSLSPDIVIGEIQENAPQFDFHQFHPTLLVKESDNNDNCMFGSEKKLTCADPAKARTALGELVKGVAKAGKYCFMQSGRTNDFITSGEFSDGEGGQQLPTVNNPVYSQICLNRYIQEKIPDPKYQIQYENNRMKWVVNTECDNVNEVDLMNLITKYELPDGEENMPLLNYNSASEYYTICMAFGMVDSVLKNMNLKNFRNIENGPNFYCAFYDMDCALEEANDGMEKISYLAATDYWYSPMNANNRVSIVEKKNDYWDSRVGSGFDFTSSYLFSVVKYAKSIFENLPDSDQKNEFNTQLSNYPQNFWASLRKYGGELQSAEYFIKNYFKSGITTTFEYLASLNYRVKYLYRGKSFDSSDNYTEKYLANVTAFNGSRKIKAKNWLTKRLRFLDIMMNVNGLTIPISDNSSLKIPKPFGDYTSSLMQNNDITIMHSAFDSSQENQALSNFSGEVEIYAPAYTPFIFAKGSTSADMYMLPGGTDRPNVVYLTTTEAEGTRFYGSGLFTSVNKIESTFTAYKSIISDNLEKIEYGGTEVRGNAGAGFLVNAKSVREINLNIPTMGGALNIDKDCISLEKLNIAGSGFYGTFETFPNLQEVNISGVNSSSISVANSEYLTGERFYISGRDKDNKTSLNVLNITGITGNIVCEYTNIEQIRINNNTDRTASDFDPNDLSEFTISGDTRLKELDLKGFRKVSITSCNNLETLSIDGALEELYINLVKLEDEVESKLTTIYNGEKKVELDGDGNEYNVFDFTNYPNLKKVTLINCDKLNWVKLPDQNIETDGMSNNPNLMWIDTGSADSSFAFRDDDPNGDNDGYIDGIFPTYSTGPKLILCSQGAFNNCPKYAMLRSDFDKVEERTGNSNYKYYTAYTNITVSTQCRSLANTFCVESGVDSNDKFVMKTAIRFIEKCVPDNVAENITSLSGCFKGRKNIKYDGYNAEVDHRNPSNSNHTSPILSRYLSVNDISSMYEGTGVVFISKNLLDLPFENNNSSNKLSWYNFISSMSKVNISNDALYNISYRLNSYSYITFTIYKYVGSNYVKAGETFDDRFNICDFFYPFEDGKKIYDSTTGCRFDESVDRFDDIQNIETLNFGTQYIDFRGMFELFPNVKYISSFLNRSSLSMYTISGLLKPCKNIISIVNSFCESNMYNSTQEIDLYEFFNWEKNTNEITNLFEGSLDSLSNGFEIYKTITYDNFKKILTKIEGYTKLTRLTNLFSYCRITGYDNTPIKFSQKLTNITNISNLFEHCTSTYTPLSGNNNVGNKGIYGGGVLNIGRSFFEQLPNVTVAKRALADTYLSCSLTYDYFCKRRNETTSTPVYLSENGTSSGTLYEYTYSSSIINLEECFSNTKFVNCKNWFDETDEGNIKPNRNYISYNGETYNERGKEYYKYNGETGSYVKYVLDNDVIDDCLDNYTDFVPQNSINNTSAAFVWYNHDIYQDLIYYGNLKDGKKPFDSVNTNCNNTIQQTYCCLPPDFLYGCSSSVNIDGIFKNSNIIGVIPRNLTKKVKDKSIANIFRNVNIMPNLEYYYDVNGGLNNSILDKVVEEVDVEGGISEEYCVVFRDKYGILKKRQPIVSDRNLGQFVYVPANFVSGSSIVNAFNFRYNLPKHWILSSTVDIANAGYYKTTSEFNAAIEAGSIDATNLPYHSQYYFLTTDSVNWENVYESRSVFISTGHDIDFGNKNTMGYSRTYYDSNSETGLEGKNTWTVDSRLSTSSSWTQNVIEHFYVDLNLCGKKNAYNMIEDNGCPIIIKNRSVQLDNFVSGALTIFLNGRVFDKDFLVNDLSSSYHKASRSSPIIGYDFGFGKNMILPYFRGSLSEDNFVFIPIDNDYKYYDFMVDGDSTSKANYNTYFGSSLKTGVLFDDKYNKYTF